MKSLITILLFFAVVSVGCFKASGDYTGTEYMPDMKHSQAYEIYTPNPVFENGLTAQLPAEGSVARGFIPYTLPNTNDGYETAGKTITSPFNNMEHKNAIANGKALYTIYCAVCHGKGGEADGTIVKNGKYPPPPSYLRDDILALPEGKMFHSVTHGKNLMGGYYSQVNQTERWQIISFIKDLQAKHIAKRDKISETAALNKIFKGSGYISEAEYAKQHAHTSELDAEYADVMHKADDYNFKFKFSKHGAGAHSDSHGHDDHGSHGNENHDGHGKGHDDHGKKGHH